MRSIALCAVTFVLVGCAAERSPDRAVGARLPVVDGAGSFDILRALCRQGDDEACVALAGDGGADGRSVGPSRSVAGARGRVHPAAPSPTASPMGEMRPQSDFDGGHPPFDTLGGGGVEPDGYGPGMGVDRYGRAVPHEPFLEVEPNAYGAGIGMDQYGRPVR